MKTRQIVAVSVAIGGLVAAGLALAQQAQQRGEPQRQDSAQQRDADAQRAKEQADAAKAREERQRQRRERASKGDDYEPEEDPRNIPER